MSFDTWEALIRVGVSVVTLLTGVAGFFRGPGKERENIRRDAELLKALPDDVDARDDLAADIGRRVRAIIDDQGSKRDWPMFVVSIIVAPGLGFLSLWLFQRDTWWGWVLVVPAVFLTLLFLYGVFETAQKVPRDEKGKRKEGD